MKTRHGMEIKHLLQQKRLSKSRFNNIDSQVSLRNHHDSKSVQRHPQSNLKKNESVASLHTNNQIQQHRKARKSVTGLEKLQQRYHQLYQQYLRLVDQQKTRMQLCRKQSQQIGKYEKAAERDQAEIERLRSLMGFVNKKDYGTQTIMSRNSDDSNTNVLLKGDDNNKANKLKKSRQQQQFPDKFDSIQSILSKPLLLQKNFLLNNDGRYKTTHQQQNNINNDIKGVILKTNSNDNTILNNKVNSTTNLNSTVTNKSEINYFKKSRVKQKQTISNSNINYSAIVVHNVNDRQSSNNDDSVSFLKKQRKQSVSLNNNNNRSSVAKPSDSQISSKKQFQSQKKVIKKYELLYSGSGSKIMAQSMLYGSKSTNDLRKKRTPNTNNHQIKASQLLTEHSHELIKHSRANSPNSRYKFIPSVDI